MTEEFAVAKTPVFAPPFAPERHFKAKKAPPDHYFASYKRHITHRWCSRLSVRGVPDKFRECMSAQLKRFDPATFTMKTISCVYVSPVSSNLKQLKPINLNGLLV
jgi:hypothetical protein